MALSTSEITAIRELLKEKYSTLFASKTDTEIDTLIGYGDAIVNDNCKIRALAIEYWVAFTVDTEDDSTTVTGAIASVEVGDIKTDYATQESDTIYSTNLYGMLYEQALKDCSKMFVGIIA